MSNLRLLNETTISSSISSITITDLFTDDFDIYKVIITVEAVSVTDANLRLVNSAGSIVTSSQQDTAIQVLRANSSFSELKTENENFSKSFSNVFGTFFNLSIIIMFCFNNSRIFRNIFWISNF